jgi:hypothetical protein
MLQNLPSIVAAQVLNPQPGSRVLDMCAGGAGSSTWACVFGIIRRACSNHAGRGGSSNQVQTPPAAYTVQCLAFHPCAEHALLYF